jgi:hypothetical protein
MHEKLPYCPFFFDDFLGDDKVLLMADGEIVDYLRLLAYEWKNGYVPTPLSALATICLRDLRVMKSHWKHLAPCFQPSGQTGRLLNKRMELERVKCLELRRKRSDAARLGGLAKAARAASDAPSANALLLAEQRQCLSSASAVRRQSRAALPRASLSLSKSMSVSLEGKEGSGKPSGESRGAVDKIVQRWIELLGDDPSLRSTARTWIAARLGLAPPPGGATVPRATSRKLLAAIECYADESRNAPKRFRFKAKNFFAPNDGQRGAVEDYLTAPPSASVRVGPCRSVSSPPPSPPPPLPQEPIPALWTAGMTVVQNLLDEDNWSTWFKTLTFRAVIGSDIHADCPSEFNRRWILRNFADAVATAWPIHQLILHVIPQEET